jgi:hypothetical protein
MFVGVVVSFMDKSLTYYAAEFTSLMFYPVVCFQYMFALVLVLFYSSKATSRAIYSLILDDNVDTIQPFLHSHVQDHEGLPDFFHILQKLHVSPLKQS